MFEGWMVGKLNKKTFESAMASQYLCGLHLGVGGVELTNLNCWGNQRMMQIPHAGGMHTRWRRICQAHYVTSWLLESAICPRPRAPLLGNFPSNSLFIILVEKHMRQQGMLFKGQISADPALVIVWKIGIRSRSQHLPLIQLVWRRKATASDFLRIGVNATGVNGGHLPQWSIRTSWDSKHAFLTTLGMETSTKHRSSFLRSGPNWEIPPNHILLLVDIAKIFPTQTLSNASTLAVRRPGHHRQDLLRQVLARRQLQGQAHPHRQGQALRQGRHRLQTSLLLRARNASWTVARTFTKLAAPGVRVASLVTRGLAPVRARLTPSARSLLGFAMPQRFSWSEHCVFLFVRFATCVFECAWAQTLSVLDTSVGAFCVVFSRWRSVVGVRWHSTSSFAVDLVMFIWSWFQHVHVVEYFFEIMACLQMIENIHGRSWKPQRAVYLRDTQVCVRVRMLSCSAMLHHGEAEIPDIVDMKVRLDSCCPAQLNYEGSFRRQKWPASNLKSTCWWFEWRFSDRSRWNCKWVLTVWWCVQHASQFVSIGNIAATVCTKIAPWGILAWLTSFCAQHRLSEARNTTDNQFLNLWVDSTSWDVCTVCIDPY